MSRNNTEQYNTPVLKLNQPDDSQNFKPLPPPPGAYPFHLTWRGEENPQELVFHMLGDTGSVGHFEFQHKVVAEMIRQYRLPGTDRPNFLYHLGDIVYNYGEAEHYPEQFFEPYQYYPAPIFAIAGNHDTDVNPDSAIPYQSLDTFMAVFCDTQSRPVSFSGDIKWKSNVQPNVYWTMKTPLANIIGLHSNVSKYGGVSAEQREWFVKELKSCTLEKPGKALILCLHHAPYSADINHGSSLAMIQLLNQAFEESGVIPNAVFSGHVHNYQRFHKHFANSKTVPFIVAGAGGYDTLHVLAQKSDGRYSDNHPAFENVTLENYCDNLHGFLKIKLTRLTNGVQLTGEYYTIPRDYTSDEQAVLTDRFSTVC